MRYAGSTALPQLPLPTPVPRPPGLRPCEAPPGSPGRRPTGLVPAALRAVAVPPIAAPADPHLRSAQPAVEDPVVLRGLDDGLLPP
jgi:hypothetical protein